MAGKLNTVWSDPVWSKVIAAGVITLLSVFLSIILYFLDLWPSVWTHLMKSSTLSNIWLYTLIIFFFLGLIYTISKIYLIYSKKLSKGELAVLIDLSKTNHGFWSKSDFQRHLQMNITVLEHYLDLLISKKMIYSFVNINNDNPTRYYLDKNGRTYLVKSKLV